MLIVLAASSAPQVHFRTISDIVPGQELLLNYGDSYWDPEDAVVTELEANDRYSQ